MCENGNILFARTNKPGIELYRIDKTSQKFREGILIDSFYQAPKQIIWVKKETLFLVGY